MTPEERCAAKKKLDKFCENHVCYECLFDNDDDCLMPDTETATDRVLQAAVDRIRERRPVTADQSAKADAGKLATDRDEYQKTGIGWIPISKDQPKTNGQYLTTTMHGEVYGDYWRDGRFNRTETVIAWAPMPEPYKWDREKNRQNDSKTEG